MKGARSPKEGGEMMGQGVKVNMVGKEAREAEMDQEEREWRAGMVEMEEGMATDVNSVNSLEWLRLWLLLLVFLLS